MIWQLCYLKLLPWNDQVPSTFIIFIDALDEWVKVKLDELVLKCPHVSFLRKKIAKNLQSKSSSLLNNTNINTHISYLHLSHNTRNRISWDPLKRLLSRFRKKTKTKTKPGYFLWWRKFSVEFLGSHHVNFSKIFQNCKKNRFPLGYKIDYKDSKWSCP